MQIAASWEDDAVDRVASGAENWLELDFRESTFGARARGFVLGVTEVPEVLVGGLAPIRKTVAKRVGRVANAELIDVVVAACARCVW